MSVSDEPKDAEDLDFLKTWVEAKFPDSDVAKLLRAGDCQIGVYKLDSTLTIDELRSLNPKDLFLDLNEDSKDQIPFHVIFPSSKALTAKEQPLGGSLRITSKKEAIQNLDRHPSLECCLGFSEEALSRIYVPKQIIQRRLPITGTKLCLSQSPTKKKKKKKTLREDRYLSSYAQNGHLESDGLTDQDSKEQLSYPSSSQMSESSDDNNHALSASKSSKKKSKKMNGYATPENTPAHWEDGIKQELDVPPPEEDNGHRKKRKRKYSDDGEDSSESFQTPYQTKTKKHKKIKVESC